MCPCFTKCYAGLIAFGNFLKPFFLLAIRLFFGWEFFKAGLGKLDDIGSLAGYFETLNIPAPHFSAYLAAITELVGGVLLMIGFASRLIAIPLIITMIVALFTAHFDISSKLFDDPVRFISQAAFVFLMASATILVFGPGAISIDGALKRCCNKDKV